MFWLLLLCHFIADYPLQTDGMVIAKKQFPGLFMHVFIHFVTLLTLLCSIMKLEITTCVILALSLSMFHFGIDHWKNVLSRLRPTWIKFAYIQDQFLHLLSIFIVSFIYGQYSLQNTFHIGSLAVFYTLGLLLITHFWFISERVFSCKNPDKLQWVNSSMWPRMMSRGMLYGILFTVNSISAFVLLLGSIVVAWNDFKPENRLSVLAIDLTGTMFLTLTFWLVGQWLL